MQPPDFRPAESAGRTHERLLPSLRHRIPSSVQLCSSTRLHHHLHTVDDVSNIQAHLADLARVKHTLSLLRIRVRARLGRVALRRIVHHDAAKVAGALECVDERGELVGRQPLVGPVGAGRRAVRAARQPEVQLRVLAGALRDVLHPGVVVEVGLLRRGAVRVVPGAGQRAWG